MVTDEDRKRAVNVLAAILEDRLRDPAELRAGADRIAAALAEEREKARAPFLRVAEQYESYVAICKEEGLDHGDLEAAAVDIRRAGEEG